MYKKIKDFSVDFNQPVLIGGEPQLISVKFKGLKVCEEILADKEIVSFVAKAIKKFLAPPTNLEEEINKKDFVKFLNDLAGGLIFIDIDEIEIFKLLQAELSLDNNFQSTKSSKSNKQSNLLSNPEELAL